MNNNETMDLYNKVGTQERRAVNRLLRAMASGKVEKAELDRVWRAVGRATPSQDTSKRISGYILYYKQNYAAERKNAPSSSLGDIAKVIGKNWKALPPEKRDEFNTLAKTNVSWVRAFVHAAQLDGVKPGRFSASSRQWHVMRCENNSMSFKNGGKLHAVSLRHCTCSV